MLIVAGAAPLNLQRSFPTRQAAAEQARVRVATSLASLDANDLIYQVESSQSYNPWPKLETMTAPVKLAQFGRRFHQSAQPRRAPARDCENAQRDAFA